MQLTEDEFKKRIYTAHRQSFDHVSALHVLAEESIGIFRGKTDTHYKAALVLIFPRAYKSFDSIRRLCEVASCEDAAVVLRSLLNLLVVTRWISMKPQSRAKRYLDWYWVAMFRESERSTDKIPPAWISDVRKHYQSVKSIFEYKDKSGRARMARQWFEPEAHSILDLFKEVGLEKHYEEAYRPLSGVEHSEAIAYFGILANSETKIGERKLQVQTDIFVPSYLRNGFQYFADIFRICNKTIPFADDARLDSVVGAGVTFYEAQMRAQGLSPY